PTVTEAAAREFVLHGRQVLAEPHLIGRAVRVPAARRAEVAVADDPLRLVQAEDRRDAEVPAEPAEDTRRLMQLRRRCEAGAHARVLDTDREAIPGDAMPRLLGEPHELGYLAAVLAHDEVGARVRRRVAEPGNRGRVVPGGRVPHKMR